MFSDSRGCLWSIHARVLNANGFFYLKKWCCNHTCGVAVRTDRNPRMGSEIVADVIAERVHDKPLTHPTDVKYDFKKAYGLQISYSIAWLGVEKARGELYGDHSVSFDQLRWYSNAVMEYNPGSYINLDFDEHNTRRFNRLFISFKACMDGFNHYRPLLFLDSTFLKGRFKGNLLAATGKDGNQVVAIRNSGSDLNALFDPYFHVTNYQSSYSEAIFPIPTVEKPQVISGHYGILSPTVRRPPGRPKKKRILSKREEVQQIRCGRCGCLGNHNRKTCTEPL
ncbi:hypothetical protein ACSBR2_032995 [Camellia fascicularis]